MAVFYWVGGSGDWTFSATNWSATSGGPGGAGVPSQNDDVIFNSASSGGSYVVNLIVAQCRSITTTAPAAGTLTFSSNGSGGFDVYGGNINIHGACIFTNAFAVGLMNINHIADPAVSTSVTTTFNNSGTNTREVNYKYTDTSASVALNFCLSQTCTFSSVDISSLGSPGASVTCTNSAITVLGNTFSYTLMRFASRTVTLTNTSLVMGSATSTTPGLTTAGSLTLQGTASLVTTGMAVSYVGWSTAFGGPNTVTFNPSYAGTFSVGGATIGTIDVTSNVSMASITVTGFNNTVNLTCPAVTGAVNVTAATFNTSGNTNFSSTITANASAAGGAGIVLGGAGTVPGAVTLNGAYLLVNGNTNFSSTITAVTTFSQPVSVTLFGVTNTVAGAVSLTGAAGIPAQFSVGGTATLSSTLAIINAGGIFGGGSLISGDITMTPTGSEFLTLGVANLTTPSLTVTNTDINMSGALVVNGGAGKTFSFTSNTSATPVRLWFGSLNVSTPTCSIVGAATRRVRVNPPLGVDNPTLRPFTRTGTAPTLSFVDFFGTTINGGATNYSGTRLGTDGLSSGFLPETPSNKFLVAGATGTYTFESAIWALTSGGATSVNNIPLPQDTIIIDGLSAAGPINIVSSNQLFVGSITRAVTSNSITWDQPVYVLGDVVNLGNFIQIVFNGLAFVRSGSNNRYLTVVSNTTTANFASTISVDIGAAATLIVSGTTTPTISGFLLDLFSGNTVIGDGMTLGSTSFDRMSLVVRSAARLSGGGWTLHAQSVTYNPGAIVSSSNYTIFMYSTTGNGTYTNLSPATAINGAIISRNGANITGGSTTSTNPLRLLSFDSGTPSGTNSVFISSGGDLHVQDFSSVVSGTGRVNLSSSSAATIFKTNGGTAYLQTTAPASVSVNNVQASPANTWYTNGARSGNTTGWNTGAPPASPSSGGFLMF